MIAINNTSIIIGGSIGGRHHHQAHHHHQHHHHLCIQCAADVSLRRSVSKRFSSLSWHKDVGDWQFATGRNCGWSLSETSTNFSRAGFFLNIQRSDLTQFPPSINLEPCCHPRQLSWNVQLNLLQALATFNNQVVISDVLYTQQVRQLLSLGHDSAFMFQRIWLERGTLSPTLVHLSGTMFCRRSEMFQ